MRLPHMKYSDSIVKQTQVRFGGYCHSKYARDGEIYDMRNVTANIYPLLTLRGKRAVCKTEPQRVIYKGNKYGFGNNSLIINNDLGGVLKAGDLIRLEVKGTYADNSGEYLVDRANSDGVYINGASFAVTGDINVQTEELAATLLKRAQEAQVTEEASVAYSDTQDTEGSIQYSLTDNGYTKTTVTKSSRMIYRKKTKTREIAVSYTGGIQKTDINVEKTETEIKILNTLRDDFFNVNDKAVFQKDGEETVIYIKTSRPETSSTHIPCYLTDYNGIIPESGTYTVFRQLGAVSSDQCTEDIDKSVVYDTKEEVPTSEVTSAANDVITIITEEAWSEYENTTVTRTQSYSFYDPEPEIAAIGAGDKFYYVTENGEFYYNNEYIGGLTPGKKSFAETGAFIYILPDKAVFNTNTRTLDKNFEERVTQRELPDGGYMIMIEGSVLSFGKSNTEVMEYIKDGEAYNITIYYRYGGSDVTGGTVKAHTSKTITFENALIEPYCSDIARIIITKSIPALKHICGISNRVWGCDEKSIYCSAFGQPEKWNYFETGAAGVSDNSWSIQPFDNSGEFTGCTTDRGYPLFFKENIIYKIYGSSPDTFTLESYSIPGVMKGSEKSIAKIKDDIYYLSPEGVMRFSGGISENISQEFYQALENGVGGTDGVRYYLSCDTPEGRRLFVYNTKNHKWSVEDECCAVDFAYYERRLFMLDDACRLLNINPGELPFPIVFKEDEDEPEGYIEFADYYCDSPDKKAVSKLFLRFTAESGGRVKIEINYDSEEENGKRRWELIKEIGSGSKRSYILPVIPKRADHFRIRISGKGFTLYSLSHEYYNGTAL